MQAQPTEFGFGNAAGIIIVNEVFQSGTNFFSFAAGDTLFRDYANVEINLCSRMINGGSTLQHFGNFDVMNFLWFRGAGRSYVPSEGKR